MDYGRYPDRPAQEALEPEGARGPVAGEMADLAARMPAVPGPSAAAGLPASTRLRDLIGTGRGAAPAARIPSAMRVRDLLEKAPGTPGSAAGDGAR